MKQFMDAHDERYHVILKLAADDARHPANSIITAFCISDKEVAQIPEI